MADVPSFESSAITVSKFLNLFKQILSIGLTAVRIAATRLRILT